MSYSLCFRLIEKDGNPDTSGRYLAMDRWGGILTLEFSARHGIWNAVDKEDRESAEKTAIHGLIAWADFEDVAREIRQAAHVHVPQKTRK